MQAWREETLQCARAMRGASSRRSASRVPPCDVGERGGSIGRVPSRWEDAERRGRRRRAWWKAALARRQEPHTKRSIESNCVRSTSTSISFAFLVPPSFHAFAPTRHVEIHDHPSKEPIRSNSPFLEPTLRRVDRTNEPRRPWRRRSWRR